MPQGVGAAIIGPTLFGSAGAAAAAAVAIDIGLIIGTSFAANRLAAADLKGNIQPRDIVLPSGNAPHIVVYGEAAVGGVLAYMNQLDVGNDDFDLWACVVHAAHESESIEAIYYETDLNRAGVEWNRDGDNTIVSGPWFSQDSVGRACTAYDLLGTDTQTMPTDFQNAFVDITSAFRLRGYTTTVHRWRLNQVSEEVFRGGQPRNIRALTRGKKIYDPRLDVSPGADPLNPAYAQWTTNPILCGANYLVDYWPFEPNRIDWDVIASQADVCEVQVPVPGSTQNRYSCNGAISLGDSRDDSLNKILSTCVGTRSNGAGKIRLYAGGPQSASVFIDESDIIGPMTIRTAVKREDRFNRVTGTFFDQDQAHAQTDFIPVDRGGVYLPRDNNEVLDKSVDLEMVNDEYQAQRVAWYHLNQGDQEVAVEVPLRFSGLRLEPGAWVGLTYEKFGYSNKTFRVEQLKIGESGIPVSAILSEDTAIAWQDPGEPDYSTRTTEGTITKPDPAILPPTSMTANGYALKDDHGVLVQWQNPSESLDKFDYVNVYASPDSNWNNAVLVGTNIVDGDFVHNQFNNVDPLNERDQRYYWVRSVRNGQESIREPNSDISNRTGIAGAQIDLGNDALVGQLIGGSLAGNPGFALAKPEIGNDIIGKPDRWFRSQSVGFGYVDSDRDLVFVNTIGGAAGIQTEMFPIVAGQTYRYRYYAQVTNTTSGSVSTQFNESDIPPGTGFQSFNTNIAPGQDPEVRNNFGTSQLGGSQTVNNTWTENTGTFTATVDGWGVFEIAQAGALIVEYDWAYIYVEGGAGSELRNPTTGDVNAVAVQQGLRVQPIASDPLSFTSINFADGAGTQRGAVSYVEGTYKQAQFAQVGPSGLRNYLDSATDGIAIWDYAGDDPTLTFKDQSGNVMGAIRIGSSSEIVDFLIGSGLDNIFRFFRYQNNGSGNPTAAIQLDPGGGGALIVSGDGPPGSVAASAGSLYLDGTNGEGYLRQGGAWVAIQTA